MLFDTNTKRRHRSLPVKRQEIRLFSNASTYDNVFIPIANGHLS
jgi:hypothetical protein